MIKHASGRVTAPRLLAAAAMVLLIAAFSIVSRAAPPREPVEPINGVESRQPALHALVNARIITSPGAVMERGIVLIRDGVVIDIQEDGDPPAGARVWDYEGLTILPAFIDPYVEVEVPDVDREGAGAHWNAHVMAQRSALDGGGVSESDRKSLRGMGYAIAHIAPEDGVFRGHSAIVTLAEPSSAGDASANVITPRFAHACGLDSGGWRSRSYPGSKMGAIALMRQTLLDADWYATAARVHNERPSDQPRPAPQDALEALGSEAGVQLPLLFDVESELDLLRAQAIADEPLPRSRRAIMVGSGDEYRRLQAVVDTRAPMIVPVALTEAPKVSTPGERVATSLRELMAWEQSPTNLRRLHDAGLLVAITSSKLPKDQKFFDNLNTVIDRGGLDEQTALAMLTTEPAKILGISGRVGTIARGKAAHLQVIEGDSWRAKDRKVRDLWIDGKRHEINAGPGVETEGRYVFDRNAGLAEADATVAILLDEKGGAQLVVTPAGVEEEAADDDAEAGEDEAQTSKTTIKGRAVRIAENRVGFALTGDELEIDGTLLVSAIIEGERMLGTIERPDGSVIEFTATREDEAAAEEEGEGDESDDGAQEKEEWVVPDAYSQPLGAFAPDRPYAQQERPVLITGATIWTGGPDGIIRGGMLYIVDGKVQMVGPNASVSLPEDIMEIDAKGKHITPGLIDCHSHTGISGGVNEGTLSSTAMVRIADVINPDSVAWYRELAGGLTAVSQLHGSANAIGGQNSVVKIRWGCAHPSDMKLEGAQSGIKFALGENVKQANWGDDFTTRYPQTRMGVETYIRSRFEKAREYAREWTRTFSHRATPWIVWGFDGDTVLALERASGYDLDRPNRNHIPLPSVQQPRRDLELEALAEVLAGDRLIHCHSYRQDEISMLCDVALDFGFKIGTFQHVLEGYKVAEHIKEAAIGGSAFSDWWAYKFEVFDAIPENGAIMHEVGVNVSYNSDSDELARRLNTEAAKAVKYGGVDPHEALKFVTLNPAIQLGIDDRVGSLEPGKDADFVIWSGDPLSTLSRCESTWIDGVEYFNLERDAELRAMAQREKRRIIQRILADPKVKPEEPADNEQADPNAPERDEELSDAPPEWIADMLRAGASGHELAEAHHHHHEEARTHEELEREYLWLVRNGFDPDVNRPGQCGCGRHSAYHAR